MQIGYITDIDSLILSIFETPSCLGPIMTTQQIYDQDENTRGCSSVEMPLLSVME